MNPDGIKEEKRNKIKNPLIGGKMSYSALKLVKRVEKAFSLPESLNEEGRLKRFFFGALKQFSKLIKKIYGSKFGKIVGTIIGLGCGVGLSVVLLPLTATGAGLGLFFLSAAAIFAIPVSFSFISNRVRNMNKSSYESNEYIKALEKQIDSIKKDSELEVEEKLKQLEKLKSTKHKALDKKTKKGIKKETHKEFSKRKSTLLLPIFSFATVLLMPTISAMLFFPPLAIAVMTAGIFGGLISVKNAISSSRTDFDAFNENIDQNEALSEKVNTTLAEEISSLEKEKDRKIENATSSEQSTSPTKNQDSLSRRRNSEKESSKSSPSK